ncbi:hypothetical protein KY320_01820 [Candidatus Woesearchaeota archaeon]|nr:hypothetical protein [Candidatus Woesearchaeota archaeon]
MKHPIVPTLILVLVFVVAQLTGLLVVSQYVDIEQTHESGITVRHDEMYEQLGVEPPEVGNESTTFIFIIIAVLIGTALVMLIIKFKKKNLWKAWYTIAVLYSLSVALNPLLVKLLNLLGIGWNYLITLGIAVCLSLWKVFRPNVVVHNLTEIFIYGGIAALLVPVINIFSAIVLLLIISLYDAYAVWKSKHMVSMAKFQSSANLFAGLSIPYKMAETRMIKHKVSKTKRVSKSKQAEQHTSAILGGGDIAFPLLFSGVVLKTTGAYLAAIVVTLFATLSLGLLFLKSERGKFYPAMPFLSAGCFIGYVIALLVI